MSRTCLQDIKVPEAALTPRKNRTVSFRVTDDIYEVLEVAATGNNINFSTLLSYMVREYLEIHSVMHRKAQYFNSLSEEEQKELLRQEKDLPPEFRHFAVARKCYPNAGGTGGG